VPVDGMSGQLERAKQTIGSVVHDSYDTVYYEIVLTQYSFGRARTRQAVSVFSRLFVRLSCR
jgi:hypothetical protein